MASDARRQANLAINEATKAAGGVIVAPSVKPIEPTANSTTPISATVLNTPSYVVPPPVNDLSSRNKLSLALNSYNPAQAASPTVDPIRQRIAEIAGIQNQQSDFTAQAQKDAGLETARTTFNDVQNQYINQRASYQEQIKRMKENSGGQFGGANQADINKFAQDADQHLANIQLQAQVAQGNLQTALSIVEDKVKAKFEPLKNEIQTLQNLYTITQNDMSESEKLQAQMAIDDKKRKMGQNDSAYSVGLKQLMDAKAPQAAYAKLEEAVNDPSATPASILASISGYSPLTREEKDQLLAQEQTKKMIPALDDKMNQIKGLQNDIVGLSSSVGPNKFSRLDPSNFLTGARQNFVAGVEQIISKETLDTLVNLKAQGGTLGALSDAELAMLEASASKITKWRIVKDGQVVGYNTTEKAFKAELDNIKKLAERAINKAYGFDMDNADFLNSIPGAKVDNATYFGNL